VPAPEAREPILVLRFYSIGAGAEARSWRAASGMAEEKRRTRRFGDAGYNGSERPRGAGPKSRLSRGEEGCHGAKRGGLLSESQSQNLTLTVLCATFARQWYRGSDRVTGFRVSVSGFRVSGFGSSRGCARGLPFPPPASDVFCSLLLLFVEALAVVRRVQVHLRVSCHSFILSNTRVAMSGKANSRP